MLRTPLTDDEAAKLRAAIANEPIGLRAAADLAEAKATVTNHTDLDRDHPQDADGLRDVAWITLKADQTRRRCARTQRDHSPRDAA